LEQTPRSTVPAVVTQTISQTAAEAGVSPDTLRYYERLGLLDAPERTASGYRVYDAGTAGRVRFIKGAQRTGLRLTDIKDLLEIRDRGACPCGHTRTLVERRIGEVDAELRRLRELRRELTDMLAGLERVHRARTGRLVVRDRVHQERR
jgi:MerR family mercuric resistance operon transcriptional regulator